MRMDWEKLLSTQKLAAEEKEPEAFSDYPINEFEKDYHKIVASAPFRRLQDKTQVFPLDKSDFIRTRLTHSIEVSTIARQLGIMLSKNKTKRRPKDIDAEAGENIASVLLCAGLLHDLGNPPFGHFGETMIGEWFQNNLGSILYKCREKDKPEEKKTVRDVLAACDEQMISDLEHFEGNAQAFRILAKACHGGGINISAAVMSALVKYPTASDSFHPKDEDIRKHKPGYYLAERNTFFKVADIVGTRNEEGQVCRHPLAYLVEAADDIAYGTADLEDAFKKKLFTLRDFIEFFEGGYDHSRIDTLVGAWGYAKEHYCNELIQDLKERMESQPGNEAFRDWMKYTRRWMMHNVIYRFSDSYEDIMSGVFEKDLFFNINHSITIKILKNAMVQFVFNTPGILKLELSSQTILSFLLDKFVHAVLYYGYEEKPYELTKADQKFLSIFSENYKKDYEQEKNNEEAHDLYLRLLMVADFVSGMTDTYARTLYRELSGIE